MTTIKPEYVIVEAIQEQQDLDYTRFLLDIQNHFHEITNTHKYLFSTNVEKLTDIYLSSIPEEYRQHYNCNACKSFISKFGNLVVINDDNTIKSAIWGETSPFFAKVSENMKKAVESAPIDGVFLTDQRVLGIPKTGDWRHMFVNMPIGMTIKSRTLSPSQLIAEKAEDYRAVVRALDKFSIETITQAYNIIQSDTLYRGEGYKPMAKWFYTLKTELGSIFSSKIRRNLIWKAVASAPNGFCHIKSSMIGTLLDDVQNGLSINIVKENFENKMNSSTYQRSQSAPTQSAIQQAEKFIEESGIEDSLERRYAEFDEIPKSEFIWKPIEENKFKKNSSGGIFRNVVAKDKIPTIEVKNELPTVTMTWEKFQKTILPTAKGIEIKVSNDRLVSLITEANQDCDSILLWDNPFSWTYSSGIDGEMKRRVVQEGGKYENNAIRCSIMWDGPTDLDLHCIDPNGEHIYYRNRKGHLDVDANGEDGIMKNPVENMRWGKENLKGSYSFYIQNYIQRGSYEKVPFVAELEVNGRVFTCKGLAGSTGWKQDLFSFNYVSEQTAPVLRTPFQMEFKNESNSFERVIGIVKSPNLWGDNKVDKNGNHTIFLLDGFEASNTIFHRGFYVEMLIPELKVHRKVLEGYLAKAKIENQKKSTAGGVGYIKDSEWNAIVRVEINGAKQLIKIDRFD